MKRKTEREKQRAKEWRAKNPELVRKQQERKRLRAKGLLAPYIPPPKKTDKQRLKDQAARMKEFHSKRQERIATDPEFAAAYRAKASASDKLRYERRKADPEAYAAWLAHKRQQKFIRYRLLHGIPLDAPYRLKITDEERAKRSAENEQRKLKRAAKPKTTPRPKMTEDELAARRKARKQEYNKKHRDQIRAKRAAEVEADKSKRPPPSAPVVCPDPPELQALFKKAAKGDPVRPPNQNSKKRSAFQIRGWI